MKTYLRLILEVLLGICLLATATLAYMNYSAKKQLANEVVELTEQLEEAQAALEKPSEETPLADEKPPEVANTVVQELDALKAAFTNGVVLQDMETLYKAQKSMTAERQVGLASLRLLTKGAQDESTIAAFQKALEMAEWSNRLQTVCAAQNALAAAGQNVKVLSDCKKSTDKPEPAADKAKEDLSKKDDKAHDVHWGYEGDKGPEHWGDNFPICGKGKKQSPLNIIGPFEKSKDTLTVDYKEGPLKMLNNGHTIQVNVEPGSTLTIGKESFDLLQFHFHRPSEEQVDGKNAAMVAHFVHKNKEGKLAVIGVMLNERQRRHQNLVGEFATQGDGRILATQGDVQPGQHVAQGTGFLQLRRLAHHPALHRGRSVLHPENPRRIVQTTTGQVPLQAQCPPGAKPERSQDHCGWLIS